MKADSSEEDGIGRVWWTTAGGYRGKEGNDMLLRVALGREMISGTLVLCFQMGSEEVVEPDKEEHSQRLLAGDPTIRQDPLSSQSLWGLLRRRISM